MAGKLSAAQRMMLAEIDWDDQNIGQVSIQHRTSTVEALRKRGLITAQITQDGKSWKCSITDQGLYALRDEV